jgi:transposase
MTRPISLVMAPADFDGLSRDDLVAIILRQARRLEEQDKRIRRLEALLEETRRGGKRQAAPFSKGPPKAAPKRPGRKPGEAHGPSHFRPPPAAVDEDLDAPLPAGCPGCGDVIEEQGVEEQWQTDIIPARAVRRRFRIHVGRCRGCRRRVQGRHPFQTSDALGAAASQLGPNALSVATFLRGEMGASFGKIQNFLGRVLGVEACRGGLALALQRVARKAEPTYESLVETIRQSPVVYADETGARMRGTPWWLWAFTTPDTTVYLQRPSRGFDVIDEVLGVHWAGKINHDGWTPYERLLDALHQQCLFHPLSRIKEMLKAAPRGTRGYLKAVKRLFQDAIDLHDRFLAGEVSPHGLAVARGRLGARQGDLLGRTLRYGPSRTFQKHLRRHHNEWLTFLWHPEIDPTNARGEQAVRPAVLLRKTTGGHRSPRGARAQDIASSLLRTSRQRGTDAIELFVRIVCAPTPIAFPIAPRAP